MGKKSFTPQSISGTYDIEPGDQKYWHYIFKKAGTLLTDYSFEPVSTALIEPVDVFIRSAGSASDLLERDLVSFKGKDGQDLCFKLDNVPSVARAYLERGMQAQPHPIKLSYSDLALKNALADRKFKQAHQLGVITIGDHSEVVDAELLFLAHRVMDSLGFHNYNVHINTIGDQNCRSAYVRALKDFYKTRFKKLCANCRDNFKINVFRLLECREVDCKESSKNIPQMVDFLDESCKSHFKHVLEFLDAAKIPYILDPYLVRNHDYHTRTVFEFWPEEITEHSAPVISGGRYDRLVELIGGSKTPAAGWTLDTNLAVALIKERNSTIPEVGIKPKIFLVQLGEAAKRKSLLLFEDIRKAGVEIKYSLSRDSIKSQLRIASRLGVRFTLIFGQKEAIENTVILREMETGIQETIPLEKLIDELKKRLKK